MGEFTFGSLSFHYNIYMNVDSNFSEFPKRYSSYITFVRGTKYVSH
jgi:hypothetical protein